MKQRKFIIVLLVLFYQSIFSQNDNYIEYYQNIEQGILKGVFKKNSDSTIYYFNIAFEKAKPFSEDLLILSKVLYEKGEKEKAFSYLIKSIKEGIDSVSIRKIKILKYLNQNDIKNMTIEYENYQTKYDTVLYFQIDSVVKLEQQKREYVMAHKNDSLFEKANREMLYQDSLNRIWILQTIKEKGWAGRRLIGNDRKSFTLLLHIKKPWIDSHFDILREQIIKGNLNPSFLAGTIDRYLFNKSGIKYGSYLPGNINITDTDEMKNNRKKIGALKTNVLFYRMKFRHREYKPKNK